MFKRIKPKTTSFDINKSYRGETIEQRVQRIINNKDHIKDSAPIIYTERKDGVAEAHDIRTDRWDVAIHGTDYITKSALAKREQRIGEEANKNMKIENNEKPNGGTEPIHGTGQDTTK